MIFINENEIRIQLGLEANTAENKAILDQIMNEITKAFNKTHDLKINYTSINGVLQALEKYQTKLTDIKMSNNDMTDSLKKVNLELKDTHDNVTKLDIDLSNMSNIVTTTKTTSNLQANAESLSEQVQKIRNSYNTLYTLREKEASSQDGSYTKDYYTQKYKEEKEALNDLLNTTKAYSNLKLRDEVGTGSEKLSNLEEIITAKQKDNAIIQQQQEEYQKLTSYVNDYTEAVKKYQQTESSKNENLLSLRQSELSEAMNNLSLNGVKLTSIDDLTYKLEYTGTILQKDSELGKKLEQVLTSASQKSNESIRTSYQEESNEKLQNAIKLMKEYYSLKVQVAKLNEAKSTGNEYESVAERYSQVKKEVSGFSDEIKKNNEYINAETEANNKANISLAKLQNNVERTGVNFGTFGKRILTVAQNVLTYQLAWRALNSVDDIIINSVRKIYELDTAMTNVQLVTNQTDSQTQQLINTYADLAYQLGSTTTDVADASVEILRMGKSQEETSQILQSSTMLSKLGMIDATESTELMTSTLNGFNLSAEESSSVVDKLVSLDLKYATSASEISTALKYVAASAGMANISLDEMAAMITVVSDKSRRAPESIGQSFKSMLARLQNIKVGKFVDDDTQESLNDVEKVLKSVGIKLRSDATTWRDASDVLNEIGTSWQKFNDIEKSAITTALGGTRQRENLIITFENWDEVLKATNISLESNGTATEKYQIYLDSLSAKINQFTAAWEKLVNNLNLSNTAKNIVDTGTTLIQILDWLISKSGLLQVALGGIVFPATVSASASGLLSIIGKITEAQTNSGKNSTGSWFLSLFNYTEQYNKAMEQAVLDTNNLSVKMIKLDSGEEVLSAINKTTGITVTKFKTINNELEEIPITGKSVSELTNNLQGSTKAVSGFSKALVSIQAVSGWLALAGTAVALFVNAIRTYNQAQQEAREKAIDFSSSIQENITSLDDYKDRIIELRKSLDTESLSFEDAKSKREELFEIQTEIINQYGEETTAIDLLTESTDKSAKAFEDLKTAQYEALINDPTTKKTQRKAEEYVYGENYSSYASLLNQSGIMRNISLEGANKIQEYNKESGLDVSTTFYGKSFGKTMFESIDFNGSRKEYIDYLNGLSDLLQEWGKESGEDVSNVVEDIGTILTRVSNDTYTENIDVLDGVGEARAHVWETGYEDYREYTKNLESATEDLNSAILSGSEQDIETASKTAIEAQSKALEAATNDPLVTEYYESLLSPYQSYIDEVTTKTKIETDETIKNMVKSFKGLSSEDIFNSDKLSASFYKLRDELEVSTDDLLDILSELGTITIPENLSFDYSSEIATYSQNAAEASDNLELLVKAQKEVTKTGSISSDTYDKIIKQFGETSNLIDIENGKLKVNSEEFLRLSRSKVEQKVNELKILKLAYEQNNKTQTTEYQGVLTLIDTYERLLTTIKTTSSEIEKSYSDINTSVDNLQSAYNTLKSAMEEYEQTNSYSLDTLQNIISLSPEYLNLLTDENGNIQLTTESLKKLTKARIEDLAYRKKQDLVESISAYTTKKEQIDYVLNQQKSIPKTSDESLLAGVQEGIPKDYVTQYFKAIDDATNKAIEGIDTDSFYSGSNSSKTDSLLKNSSFYSKKLKDIVAPLKDINTEIDTIQYNIDKANALKNLKDTETFTDNLITKKQEQKDILQTMLDDTQFTMSEINAQFSQFANVPMTEEGIAKFTQYLDNAVTTIENKKNKVSSGRTALYDTQIQELQNTKTEFEEYTTSYNATRDQKKDLKKQIEEIDLDIIESQENRKQIVIDQYDEEQKKLDQMHNLNLISDREYYDNSIILIEKYFKDRVDLEDEYYDHLAKMYELEKEKQDLELSNLEQELSLLQQKNKLLEETASTTLKISSSSNSGSFDYWTFMEGNYDSQISKLNEIITLNKKMEDQRRTYLISAGFSLTDILSDENLQTFQNNISDAEESIIDLNKTSYDNRIEAENDYIDKRNMYNDWGNDSEIEATKRMIDITDQYYAERKLSDKEYYDSRNKLMSTYMSLQQDLLEQQQQEQEDLLNEQETAINDLIDKTISLIKQEQEAEKERHQQLIDDFKDEADRRKEALDDESEDRDYNKELKKKEKSVSDLEKKLASLQLDTSGKSAATIKQTEEDLATAREELEDYQYENSIEKQKEAIDDEVDLFTDKEQQKIDIIEDYLSKEGQIRSDAINQIQSNWNNLYTQLIDWNRTYGTGVDSDITNAWETAQSALISYSNTQKDVLSTLEQIQSMQDSLSSNTATATYDYTQMLPVNSTTEDETKKNTIQQMISNSLGWSNATTDTQRQYYADQNQTLGKSIGLYYNSAEGRWYEDSGMTIPAYASGGVTGNGGLSQLHANEVVLNENQALNTLHKLSLNSNNPSKDLYELSNNMLPMRNLDSETNTFGNIMPITIQGNLDKTVIPDLQQIANKVIENINSDLKLSGIKRNVRGFSL